MKTIKTIFFIILIALTFMSCKRTYYNYELEKICEACEAHGGVNRMYSDFDQIIVRCNDGERVVLRN
jgi:hypothetical protein